MTYLGLPGHLATITSAGENAFAGALCKNMHCWLGGSDEAVEGTFRWVAGPENGQVVSPTFWNPGEPNNSGNEDYINYWDTEAAWNDGSGNTNMYYLVEFEACKDCECLVLSCSSCFCGHSWTVQRTLLPSCAINSVIQRCIDGSCIHDLPWSSRSPCNNHKCRRELFRGRPVQEPALLAWWL